MRVPAVWWVAGAAVLFGGGAALGCYVRASQTREQAAADQATIAAHETTIAALREQAARLDTVYLEQTVERLRTRTRWDTVRLVTRTTDTLVSVDTLRLVVAVADSAIQACEATLTTCEQRMAVARQWRAADSSAIRSLSRELARARLRSRLACTVGPTASLSGVDYIGVACGLRVF